MEAVTVLIRKLEEALRGAGLAITHVAIGDPADRATWRVTPASLQAAAQPMIDSFALPTAPEVADEEAKREVDVKILKAIVIELHAAIPAWAGKPTLAQLRDNIIARYKAL